MQKIVGDGLRPDGRPRPVGSVGGTTHASTPPTGFSTASSASTGAWTAGRSFTIADCAAAPALFYARAVHRWDEQARPR